jgi:hypothetical protein
MVDIGARDGIGFHNLQITVSELFRQGRLFGPNRCTGRKSGGFSCILAVSPRTTENYNCDAMPGPGESDRFHLSTHNLLAIRDME